MERLFPWLNISWRIMILCSSLYLILDSIVKTRGVGTLRCMIFFLATVIATAFAFTASMFLFDDECCEVCGSIKQGFPNVLVR